MDKDSILFDDKSFSDLLRDVYTNTKKKDVQVSALINQLKELIKNITDASMIVPLIKEYLEISVKNDDNLVRLTAIVQRLRVVNKNAGPDEGALSEAEKQQLLHEAQAILDQSSK